MPSREVKISDGMRRIFSDIQDANVQRAQGYRNVTCYALEK
jgi:hypothetical protein